MASKQSYVVETRFQGADGGLSGTLRSLEGQFDKVASKGKIFGGKGAGGLFGGMGGMAVAGGAIAAGFAAVNAAGNTLSGVWQDTLAAESALVRAGTKFPGIIRKGTAEYKALAAAAQAAAATGMTSNVAAAQGLEALGSAGLSAGAAIGALKPMLAMSAVAGVDLATAVQMSADSMMGMGLPSGTDADIVSSMQKVSDSFVWASNATTASVADISDAFAGAAPVAHGFGLTLAETAGTVGILSRSNIQGANAGTALKGVLASLTATTGAGHDAMRKYGIQLKKTATGGLDLFGTLANVADATKGMDQVQAQQVYGLIAGRENVSAFSALIQAGPKDLRAFRDAAADSAGSTAVQFAALADTSEAKMSALKNRLNGLATELGASAGNSLQPLVDMLDKLTVSMSAVASKNKELVSQFGGGLARTITGFFQLIIGLAAQGYSNVRKLWVITKGIATLDSKETIGADLDAVEAETKDMKSLMWTGTKNIGGGLYDTAAGGVGLIGATAEEMNARYGTAMSRKTTRNGLPSSMDVNAALAPRGVEVSTEGNLYGGMADWRAPVKAVAPIIVMRPEDQQSQAPPQRFVFELPKGVKVEQTTTSPQYGYGAIDVRTSPTGGL